MTAQPVVLLPYDRSVDAEAAIDRVAELVPDAALTVMTIWRPAVSSAAEHGGAVVRADVVDGAGYEAAFSRASVGARHAAAAGVLARARCQVETSGVVSTIIDVADELDADLIVMGRHGRSGHGYIELGATVRGVMERTGRTVLVVSGHDVPHRADPPGSAGAATDAQGHGGTRIGTWVPRTPEDERDGAR